ncbi:MAG TPA: DUF1223 domain-containing protein [Dyella sp.]|uniref:DUF1223 domain-containing protein n=1 Tax=Dyella sp. TaxID=1869338 RepID=UPI002F9272ED
MKAFKLLGMWFAGLMALTALDEVYAQESLDGDSKRPVVVELFQSQGCSSCPPADANLNALAARADILALSYAVTYWDDLGWKDTFAQQAFTDRQWVYARRRGRTDVWTPQVFINGRRDVVGTDRTQLDDAVAEAATTMKRGPALSWREGRLHVGAGEAGTYDVWLVRYDPRTLEVPIGAGENGGRVLPHRNIVRQLVRLGSWSGGEQDFTLPMPTIAGLATAAFIQAGPGGAIIDATIQR